MRYPLRVYASIYRFSRILIYHTTEEFASRDSTIAPSLTPLTDFYQIALRVSHACTLE